jgi:pimeloyl-ACP methyl ester carboxylesterase
MTTYNYADVHGNKMFYREAGDKNAPTIVLLHGFPTSSHMYRNLIPPLFARSIQPADFLDLSHFRPPEGVSGSTDSVKGI